jgi:flagellar secretion chaperone FliS
MNPSASNQYLTTQVLTAPPQKLQLMLLEAAVRACRSTRQHWRAGEIGPGGETLLRAQQIVGHLLTALDAAPKSELVGKVAGVYLFIYRRLTEAALQRDEKKLDEALKILEIERETWRQLCEKLGRAPAAANFHPHFPLAGNFADSAPAGLSLEA